MPRFAFLLLLLLLVPATARAGPTPQPRVVVPPASLLVSGAVTVSDAHVRVHCDRTDPLDPAALCTIEGHATITATAEDVALARVGDASASVLVDASALAPDGARPLSAGTSVVVAIETHAELPVERDYREGIWVVPAIYARHALFGDGPALDRSGSSADYVLVDGASVTYEGAPVIDATERGHVGVYAGGDAIDGVATLELVTPPRVQLGVGVTRMGDDVVQHGGPVLGLGARATFREDDGGRFLLTLGYELGLVEHFVVSAEIATDFDSLVESVVLEVGSPELIVIFPSVSAGIGVAARQLGDRDADAALRLRAAATVFGVGASADFDYWPAIGEWTYSVSARISL